jgi:hypothetical protein
MSLDAFWAADGVNPAAGQSRGQAGAKRPEMFGTPASPDGNGLAGPLTGILRRVWSAALPVNRFSRSASLST